MLFVAGNNDPGSQYGRPGDGNGGTSTGDGNRGGGGGSGGGPGGEKNPSPVYSLTFEVRYNMTNGQVGQMLFLLSGLCCIALGLNIKLNIENISCIIW